ncbi:MAG TPA: hypothetical protein VFF98_11050, partial [Novosphingobium sp.]|nr:hypothetical protein [Novosphingobium sp.]
DRRAQGGYSLARTSGRWWVEGAQLCRQQARPAPDAPQCESAEAYPRPGTSTASPDGQMLLILLKGWMEPIR